MSDNDGIYTFKLYNFTKVYPQNDLTPAEKENARIYCTDRHLYLCDGTAFSPSVSSVSHRPVVVFRYDFFKNEWSTVHRLDDETPRRRACCHRAKWNDLLFFRTCVFPQPSHYRNQSLYFSNLKTCGTTMDFKDVIPARTIGAVENFSDNLMVFPPQCEGYGMALNDKHLYVVGGARESNHPSSCLSMDVYMLDLETRQWKKLYDYEQDSNPPIPARARHVMVYYDDGLYIFGGFTRNEIFSLENLPVFNLKTNSWKVLETVGDSGMVQRFPSRRAYFAIAPDPHQPSVVFVHGGCDRPVNSLASFKDTWRLDLKTSQWKCIRSLTTIRGKCMHSMDTTPDGRLYLFGSVLKSEEYREFLVAWINVPKLVDMCWDAFVFYVGKGVIQLPADLGSLGLLPKYLDRLL